ncbi:MAG: hypothetical protein ACLUW6_08585 [Coriobacteriaceae bacterium]
MGPISKPPAGFLTRIEGGGQPHRARGEAVGGGERALLYEGSTYGSTPTAPSPSPMPCGKRPASGHQFGSFDVIEAAEGNFIIDASVSGVSEDCTDYSASILWPPTPERWPPATTRCATPQISTSQERSLMLTIPEVYDLFDQIGCCSFATLDGRGGVDSRIAHFFACDEEGLYLRTMDVKPFYRQLVEGGKLSVCGEKTAAPCSWDDDQPHFQPGFMVRVSGDRACRGGDREAAANPQFNVAIYDINKSDPRARAAFRLGRLYDYDFNMVHRTTRSSASASPGACDFQAPGLSPMRASSAAVPPHKVSWPARPIPSANAATVRQLLPCLPYRRCHQQERFGIREAWEENQRAEKLQPPFRRITRLDPDVEHPPHGDIVSLMSRTLGAPSLPGELAREARRHRASTAHPHAAVRPRRDVHGCFG